MAERRSPLLELTRARLLEFVRDPGAVFWVFGFPILLAVGLGIAFRSQPVAVPEIAVVGEALPDALAPLADSDTVALRPMTREAARRALRIGRVDLLVEVDGGVLVHHYDESRPEGRAARTALEVALARALGRAPPMPSRDRPFEEPGGRYIDFLLPGLIGLNLMGSGMWGIGFAVVDARKRKLLKRFAATPMRRSHFLLSFMLSRLVFLVLEVAALLLAGWLLFDVTVHGSIVSLAFVCLVGALSFSGLSVLIAARPQSTEVGAGWMNFVQLPMWVLSGAFFSYERFPEAIHPLIRALPLTALNDALRSVMNEGASILASSTELAVLLAWGVASFLVALRIFRWQ